MKSISNFIAHNTELFNMCLLHWGILLFLFIAPTFFKYIGKKIGKQIDKRVSKRTKQKIYVKLLVAQYRVPFYVYFPCLFILTKLNTSDSLIYYKYLMCFMAILPFVFSITGYFSTKAVLLIIFNLSFFCVTHISPFLSTQANEVWIYILLGFCICALLAYFSWKKVVLIFLFLIIFNFFVLSFSCITHSLDFQTLPPYVEYLMYFCLLLLYILTFLVYITLTRVFYRMPFFVACAKLENCNKLRIIAISLILVLISLCIKYIYVYNVFVYLILDYFDVIILLNGIKNPHHEWMCGPGLKHLFGSHCRKMSSMLIYKQHQHDQMNRLYHEIK